MCEDHGPRPMLVGALTSDGIVRVQTSAGAVLEVPAARGTLPVVTHADGSLHLDCLLAPPAPASWEPVRRLPGGAAAFRAAGDDTVSPAWATRATAIDVLEGRAASGELVRLRLTPSGPVQNAI